MIRASAVRACAMKILSSPGAKERPGKRATLAGSAPSVATNEKKAMISRWLPENLVSPGNPASRERIASPPRACAFPLPNIRWFGMGLSTRPFYGLFFRKI